MTLTQLFERTVREGLEAGLSKEEAEALANEVVAMHDVLYLDPETGELHVHEGPSIIDFKSSNADEEKGR